MYVVTRRDMDAGYQGVQSMHAAIQFGMEHPDIHREWFQISNYLGWLSVADEQELHRLIIQAQERGIKFSVFREPDVGDQITAVAFEPGRKTKKLCSHLPLALEGI